jgi:CheY-like chemotaxis protein
VICVDDDALLLEILTRTIGGDYEVLTSSSGAEALQLIENSERIQVVVSDHRMPGLSGAQLVQTVREKYPLIVRVLLTGGTDLVEAVAAMNQAGQFRFLLKPATRPVLSIPCGQPSRSINCKSPSASSCRRRWSGPCVPLAMFWPSPIQLPLVTSAVFKNWHSRSQTK